MDKILNLAKRLADYVRMTIEIGELKPDSPVGIAYKDFMEEWNKRHLSEVSTRPDKACAFCGFNSGNHALHCPKSVG